MSKIFICLCILDGILHIMERRRFLQFSFLSAFITLISQPVSARSRKGKGPVVVSTWDAGVAANRGAWEVLRHSGRALDAVEKGVMVTEASQNCCVGLGGNPDREGIVTLDACIMDHQFNCGGVMYLERIKHPVAVARRVMEKTPHVYLAGDGAQQFAVSEGFPLEPQQLSEPAEKNYRTWLKQSRYAPAVNRENTENSTGAGGTFDHDTIAMLALDASGNLSGSCTTSGMGFKMRGRVGDSPIIGSGLYVDNEAGACAATGQGEDIIRVAGAAAVVEYMRAGYTPQRACRKAIERLARIKGDKAKDIQVAFIAINKLGTVGAYALQKGFTYAVRSEDRDELLDAESWFS